ncbi:ArpU family phage packaging/lysis transcriptional regulator [Lacticaseibacillus zhaodongensis]|uniref:ArpU family phage packaging/lysis transcriptional regulator n=1 Tax=Lacticaseibacillus zhaodongensis TaxID=2668065 RepID=UPI0018AF57AB|nr:ArpU family phage packaging/lysis transcriptional regulator [Lacticaseibacillus zhaodongensis]
MKRVTSLHSSIDEDETAKNAEALLLEYPHYWRLSRQASYGLKSPAMDGMPRPDSTANTADLAIINKVDAGQWLRICNTIIDGMQQTQYGKTQRWHAILKERYVRGLPDYTVMSNLGIEKSQYYEERRDALIAFAEMWPPVLGQLVVISGAENNRKITGQKPE